MFRIDIENPLSFYVKFTHNFIGENFEDINNSTLANKAGIVCYITLLFSEKVNASTSPNYNPLGTP